MPAAEQATKKARQGVRYPVLEALDVLDPESMQSVPRDGETLGEVMFRGNVVMKGYLKNKQSTEAAFAGGWFHSGDLGVVHPDGYIQLKDRSKDIIISGGENISSIEVARTSPPTNARAPSCSRKSLRPRPASCKNSSYGLWRRGCESATKPPDAPLCRAGAAAISFKPMD